MKTTKHDFRLAVVAAIANLNICLFFIDNSRLATFWAVLIALVLAWLARTDPVEKIPLAEANVLREELSQSQVTYLKLQKLMLNITPLWNRHLGLAQHQMKAAIESLVLRFANLSLELKSSRVETGEDAQIFQTIASAEDCLVKIMATLNQTQTFRSAGKRNFIGCQSCYQGKNPFPAGKTESEITFF